MIDLQRFFFEIVEDAYRSKKISQSCYISLIDRFADNLDELERDYFDLLHALEQAEYYITIDRITKGEEMIKNETDESKKAEYRKILNGLLVQLDQLTPMGESA